MQRRAISSTGLRLSVPHLCLHSLFLAHRELPVALDTDEWYDKGGVFSGSATILDDDDLTPVLSYSVSTNDMLCLAFPANRSDPFLTKVRRCPLARVIVVGKIRWQPHHLVQDRRHGRPRPHDRVARRGEPVGVAHGLRHGPGGPLCD